MKKPSRLYLILAAALLLSLASGCTVSPKPSDPTAEPTGRQQEKSLYTAKSYSQVYDALKNTRENRYGRLNAMSDAVTMEAQAAPAANEGSDMSDENYSGTNVQVEGVDEGDVVKTDGRFIYMVRDNELVIIEAAGEETKLLSSTVLTAEDSQEKYFNAIEIYISEDKLALIRSGMRVYTLGSSDSMEDSNVPQYASSRTELHIFDISDRENPKKLHERAQDGEYLASRFFDGEIYLITNHYVYGESDPDSLRTYVPSFYDGDVSEAAHSDCIVICPVIQRPDYAVVGAYSLDSGELVSNLSVLGGGGTIYMNRENLYLANGYYDDGASEPYTEGSYTVIEYHSRNATEIVRIALNGGDMSVAAVGEVDGILLNQFSMDEKDGYLRLVTTIDTSNYTEYLDVQHGWANYEYGDYGESNGLFILDADLKVVGSILNLGMDERVYSVRFDGDIGYLVTFKRTDPLFAVDLSNPLAPIVLSQLKIPGFSQYMHVYGEGRLFGLGMDADIETGRTTVMKLSMFDTSDPADVTEKHTLLLNDSYSEALYNHKAVIIAPEKDFIAFPAGDGYEIYGYSDEEGFYKRARVEYSSDTIYSSYGSSRGLYIGDYAYIIVGDRISVLDMASLTGIMNLKI